MSTSFTDKQKFDKELIALCKKYKVAIGVEMVAANRLTKLLEKFIQVKWNLTIVDTEVEK